MKIRLLDFGILDVGKGPDGKALEFMERLPVLIQKVDQLMDLTKPNYFGLEEPFIGRNVRTGAVLYKCFGALAAIAFKHGLPLYTCTPMEAKSFVLRGVPNWQKASGEETKVLIKELLQSQFGVKFTSQAKSVCDDSDAVAVGLTLLNKQILQGL